ncbi:MAG: DUF4332 domain-containing protein [Candidatus Sericytochromatia bacterium]|nr:DUF4332 domain-containing protein [Candidatus Sericytochromatia bacterium]
MISKCPECERSYPSHHGAICKACASKGEKAKNPSSTLVSNTIPTPEKNTVIYRVSDSRPTLTTEEIRGKQKAEQIRQAQNLNKVIVTEEVWVDDEPAKIVEDKSVFRELDITLLSSSTSGVPAEVEKKEGVMDVCLSCGTLNQNQDYFCPNCGVMLFGSAITKVTEYSLSSIKAAFPDHVSKLKKLGIVNNMQLLAKGYSPGKRKVLALKTGVSEMLLNRLINQADLLRIDGVEPNEAYLLENIGINTMKIFERKSALDVMTAITKNKSILHGRQIMVFPEEKKVKKWVEEVKTIEKIVS